MCLYASSYLLTVTLASEQNDQQQDFNISLKKLESLEYVASPIIVQLSGIILNT